MRLPLLLRGWVKHGLGWSRRHPAAVGGLGLVLAVGLALRLALAATITVTTTADTVDGNTTSIIALLANRGADGNISLREAILAANADGASGPHTITVPAGTFALTGGQMTLTAGLTINGAGAGTTLISNASGRIFNITGTSGVSFTAMTLHNSGGSANGGAINNSSGALTLSSVTMSNNNLSSFDGGAVASAGSLTLTNCTVQNNRTSSGSGGALSLSAGTLTITGSSFNTNNTSSGGGGAIASAGGAINISTSTFTGNGTSSGSGGAIRYSGNSSITLIDTSFSSNSSGSGVGGAVSATASTDVVLSGGSFNGNSSSSSNGGALSIASGNLSVDSTTFTSNSSNSGSGGAIRYIGSGNLILTDTIFNANTANAGGGAVSATSSSSVTMIRGSFGSNGASSGGGGALSIASGTVSADSTTFTNNSSNSGSGGAIRYTGTSTLVLTNTTLNANTGSIGGGAVSSIASSAVSLTGGSFANNGTGSGSGGAVSVTSGVLAIAGTTFINNQSNSVNGGSVSFSGSGLSMVDVTVSGSNASSGAGGGLHQTAGSANISNSTFSTNNSSTSGGGVFFAGTAMTMANVTLSANTAGGTGGGLFVGAGVVVLTNLTVAANSGSSAGGIFRNGGSLFVRNTIVSANNGGNCSGTILTQGNNLDSANTCSFSDGTDLRNTSAGLAALANNGGPTLTHALNGGSAAINAGTASSAPTTDQRGYARVGATDIGAFEFGAGTTYTISGTVFEDIHYGGGAGRNLASSSGAGINNATVELYNSSGTYISSTTTAGGGAYSFAGLAASTTYHVRVASQTVASTRTGTVGTLRGVMTYRTSTTAGVLSAVTDFVGGTNPALADPASAGGGAAFNTSTFVYSAGLSGTAHAVAPVGMASANLTNVDFGFNFDSVVNTNDAGQGSLRQAITNANTLGADASLAQSGRTAAVENLVFMLSNGTTGSGGALSLTGGLRSSLTYFTSGIATITPTSALPTISTTLVINARAQQGWTAAPVVELNGTSAGVNVAGLNLSASSSTLAGLTINRFNGAGIAIATGTGNTVAGNWIGTSSAGSAAAANAGGGITVASASNTIGGVTSASRNVISGNTGSGINVASGGNTTTIRANWIGLNAAGTAALGNTVDGITVSTATGAVIGGATSGMGNAIGGNTSSAISLSSSSGHSVLGNTLGVQGDGLTPLASTGSGIVVSSTTTTTLGGIATNSGNTIRLSTAKGITITGATSSGNAIRGNAIYGSTAIGIDLANDGITVNDGAKPVSQPNLLMDSPVFTAASIATTTLTVAGYVGSAASQSAFASATVDVYVSDTANINGSGQTYLGSLTADVNGNFSGTITGVTGVVNGTTRITGVATDGSNNSSEFGANYLVGMAISGTVFEDINYGGGAGRNLASSSGAGINGATVELYNSSGTYISSTTTAGGGAYSFGGIAPSTTYHVRVASQTVASTRTGTVGTLRGVVTYRTSTTAGVLSAVTDFVGGTNPALADPASAGGGASFNISTFVYSAGLSGTAHAVAPVGMAAANLASVDFGFNFDSVVNTNDAGQGSLRQAITNANALDNTGLAVQGRTAGIEHGIFMLSNGSAAAGLRSALNYFSGGVATVNLTSALPALSSALVVDAQTQPGWTSAPVVRLDGLGAGGGVSGLSLSGGGGTVRGFRLTRFTAHGLVISSSSNTVQGNYLGTDGTSALGNGGGGLALSAGGSNQIGGTGSNQGNVISGNTGAGVALAGSGTANVLQGNTIGANAANSAALANSTWGLTVSLTSTTSATSIGGTAANTGNVIRGNTSGGISVTGTAAGVTIQGNSNFGNGGLGIDLASNGITINDNAKTAGQPNLLMDSPVFTAARSRSNQLTLAGYIGIAAGQALFASSRVEIFVSDTSSTNGSGRTYLGFLTANASGNFSGTVTLPVAALAIGTQLTATATDAGGNTSEFGANFTGLIVDMVVNDNGDVVDNTLGDGLCATAGAVCTLRAAIAELNASAAQGGGTPAIAFAIPGCTTGSQAACTISPATNLPFVARTVTIDATTQTGYAGTPMIALDGSANASSSSEALRLDSGSNASTVRGFRFSSWNGSDGYALHLFSSSNHLVQGNWFGLGADGLATVGTRNRSGVAIRGGGTGNLIGGSNAAQRNLIANSTAWGVYIYACATSTVRGNWLGVNATGNAAASNAIGVASYGAGTVIGGSATGEGNLFGAATGQQLLVSTDAGAVPSAAATVQGNTFGLANNGSALANTAADMIYIDGVASSLIGGTATGSGNTVANGAARGIGMTAASKNVSVQGNSIYSNATIGIDLGRDGVTANDGVYDPSRANNAIDTPVFNGAGVASNGASITVSGIIGTGSGQAAFAAARVEVFKALADTTGRGQGQLYLGALTADANGRFSGVLPVIVSSIVVGDAVTATATDSAGNTSEFGLNWTTTTMAAMQPAGFNAFETSTLAGSLTGVIKVMTAGQGRTLDVIAVDSTGLAVSNTFAGNVVLDWLDARDNSAGLTADGCRSSWLTVGAAGSAGTAVFVGGTARVALPMTPPQAGREWRLRMTHTPNSGPVVVSCTGDNFAVKPSTINITSVGDDTDSSAAAAVLPSRSLSSVSASLTSGGVVHRAGRPFSLRATAVNGSNTTQAWYDGTPTISLAACVLPSSGCVLGSLSVGIVSTTAGVVRSDTLAYSEVGSVQISISDSSFANVDLADSSAGERLISGSTLTVGRFVPDSYATSVTTAGVFATANGACTASGSGYTFAGQAFSWATLPQVRLTARNAAGVTTQNWTGSLMKLVAATHASAIFSIGNAGGSMLATALGPVTVTDIGAGMATLTRSSADSFVVNRATSTPLATVNPTLGITTNVNDTSEGGTAGNTATAASAVQSGISFNAGSAFHHGRIQLVSGHGDARVGVRVLVELQRFTSAGWARMSEDRGCISVPATAVAIGNGRGRFANAGICAAPLPAGSITTAGGRAWLRLPGSPGALPGAVTVRLNLGGAGTGNACTPASLPAAAGTMNLPHLRGAFGGATTLDQDPRANATWGRANREMVMRSERFD